MSKLYNISEIFKDTVQGEGAHAGWPCAFLRFQFCNYWPDASKPSHICPWCDTSVLHTGTAHTMEAILFALEGAAHGRSGLVISGGEPLLQLDHSLLNALAQMFPWIDIETNGSVRLEFEVPDNVSISCSPKTSDIKVQHVSWWKVLIPDKQHLLEKIASLPAHRGAPIYVQPVEIGGYSSELTKKNLQECLKLCTDRGYRLSLQTHKIIGVR